MKKVSRVVLSFGILFSVASMLPPAFAEGNDPEAISSVSKARNIVDSSVSLVTVYPDRAMVTRTATFDVKAGENKIVFSKLPSSIVGDSIQVSGKGDITIFDIEQKQSYQDVIAMSDDERESWETELQENLEEQKAINDEMNTLVKKEKHLESVIELMQKPAIVEKGTEVKPGLSFEEWANILDSYQDELNEIYADRREKRVALQELKKEQSRIEWELRESRSVSRNILNEVEVVVNAASDGKATLDLRYNIHGASWYPVYDVRFRETERKLDITYSAMVSQMTGEDWNDAALVLSTARPSLGAYLPEIYPWNIDTNRPQAVTYDAAKKGVMELRQQSPANYGFSKVMEEAEMDEMAVPPPPAPAARLAAASIDSGLTSAVFNIPTKITLKSGRDQKKVLIMNEKINAEMQWKSVPKSNPMAFLNVTMTNTTAFPFLAGKMNTYLNNDFIATGQMANTVPQEKFQLILGADEGVKVERKETKNFQEETGWTSKSIRRTFEYTTTVTYNKATEGRVVIFDQAPIPANEKIKVTIESPKTKDAGVEIDNMNKITWRIDMKPGEKRELKLNFVVEYPKDETVYGL